MANTSRPTSRRRKKKPGFIRSAFQLLRLSFFGRMLIISAVSVLVIGITMLAVSFAYDRFFMITGIELVVAAVSGWIVYLVKSRPARNSARK